MSTIMIRLLAAMAGKEESKVIEEMEVPLDEMQDITLELTLISAEIEAERKRLEKKEK